MTAKKDKAFVARQYRTLYGILDDMGIDRSVVQAAAKGRVTGQTVRKATKADKAEAFLAEYRSMKSATKNLPGDEKHAARLAFRTKHGFQPGEGQMEYVARVYGA